MHFVVPSILLITAIMLCPAQAIGSSLLIRADEDCVLIFDGQPIAKLEKGNMKEIVTEDGKHVVRAETENGKYYWEKLVNIPTRGPQLVLVTNLKWKIRGLQRYEFFLGRWTNLFMTSHMLEYLTITFDEDGMQVKPPGIKGKFLFRKKYDDCETIATGGIRFGDHRSGDFEASLIVDSLNTSCHHEAWTRGHVENSKVKVIHDAFELLSIDDKSRWMDKVIISD